jgi:septum formation protein
MPESEQDHLQTNPKQSLILASTSPTRQRLLRQAGLHFICQAPGVAETPIKQALAAAGAGAGVIAQALSDAKAEAVSQLRRGALVIGSDQVLDLDGRLFDKPSDHASAGLAARQTLAALSGKCHKLATAVSVAQAGEVIWRHLETPKLTMRELDEAAIEAYLAAAEDGVYGCVGAYMVEGSGIQLFSAIEGDHFAIQGLPLLPLLSFLRDVRNGSQ